MPVPVLSRSRSLRLSAVITVAAVAALVLGPVNPIGAIINGGETCRSVTPNFRAADTRSGAGGVPVGTVGPLGTLDVTVAGVGGVPADAKSVNIQLTATGLVGIDETFLVAYPAGTAQPPSSSLNPVDDHSTANGALPVEVGAGGKITVFNERGNTHILVDILQWCDEHDHDDDYGVGKVAYATGDTEQSTSSTSYVDISGATAMATTKTDGRLLITFSTETECDTSNALTESCQVQVLVDGVEAAPGPVIYETARFLTTGMQTADGWASHSHQWVSDPLPAGSHTVTVQFRASAATTSFAVDQWTLSVLPLVP